MKNVWGRLDRWSINNFRTIKQRVTALLLFILFAVSSVAPTASAISADVLEDKKPDAAEIHKSTDPGATTKEHDFSYPGGLRPSKSTTEAAADTAAEDAVGQALQGTKPLEQPSTGVSGKTKVTPRELTDKRSATKSIFVNADGTLTQRNYFSPHFYEEDGKWLTIDSRLSEDKNAGDASNVFGEALGEVQSWFSSTTNFKTEKNSWQTRFSPSDFDKGMVRVQKGSSQIGYVPVGSNQVSPVVTTDKEGTQTVHYYDLWDGVDVEYRVRSDAVKENIVLKNKNSINKVSFKLIGGALEQHAGDRTTAPYHAIKGALNDEFGISPANLILNDFGLVTDEEVFKQEIENNTITVSIDKAYLQSLPDKAFPAVIDPSTFYSTFGTRAGGNYVSLKSDGYICYSNICNPYAGTLYDSNNVLRYWRSAFFANYDALKTPGNTLISATLHLQQLTNAGFWTGNYNAHNYYVGHATCLNNFNCLENNTWNSVGTVTTSGDIDVKNIYDAMISRGDFGAWLMLGTNDGQTDSFKDFDPGTGPFYTGSYVAFTYGGPPAAPNLTAPIDGQVYVDPQPSFSVAYQNNPNGTTPLQYEFLVSNGTGGTGVLIASGRQNALQWSVPDGILQDGFTYYAQTRSYDPITNTYSAWSTSIPFRIDMRTGQDSSQAYDSLGPISVDLATGNLITAASSHASSALGGGLGISLSYNSPLKSRPGLVGQYWNNGNFTGNPITTRVDANIDFNWELGSPVTGTVANDYFSTRWKGYFVTPKDGTYYFGGSNDDSFVIKVDGQQLYSNGGCYTGVCYGTSITLQAGQIVPIEIEHAEATGPAYVRMYVKAAGAVDERIVPQEWLQTGVRSVTKQQGLTGSYYAHNDATGTFSASNPLVMKRVDPYLSFNWGSGAPASGGPNDFLTRWTGYISVPQAGTYTFGSRSDDGVKITLGANSVVYNDWTAHAAPGGPAWGATNYTFTSNTQQVPITIEYYDAGGPASFELWTKTSDGVTISQQIVPSSWLLPDAKILSDGWKLGLDVNGSVNYERLVATQNSVVLRNAAGGTHEYKWTGNGYSPPNGEDGSLHRNTDGTFTLQETNGMTYVFDKDGTLTSANSAVDDRNPAALKYSYAPINNGPTGLTKITDGLDSSRWADLYYYGGNNCDLVPAGFDALNATSNANLLCALKTDDGRTTNFYYIDGQLARVAKPGNELFDFGYEAVLNDIGATIGYRLNAVRDSLAMDAIASGQRANNDTVKTSVTYDHLGRVVSATLPAPTATASRVQHTIEYLPGAKSHVDQNGSTIPGYVGMSQLHIASANEPHGFSRRIKYDDLFRTIEETTNANLSTTTEWDAKKDLVYSVTDALGMKSTTVYDDQDRPVGSYGPAPKGWFDATVPRNQEPVLNATQVPRQEIGYDEGITGPSVAWFDYTKQTGNTDGVLYGIPKLHTTGINTATPGTLNYDFVSPPITASPLTQVPAIQGIGLSATGKLRLPAGTYTFSSNTPDGVRLWVDDQLLIDQWTDSGTSRTTTSAAFTVGSMVPKRFRLDVYRKTGTTGAFSLTAQQQNGFSATTNWSNYLKPDYSLVTSAKVHDGTIGDSVSSVSYGANPELGLAQSGTVDPAGLNLSATNSFEQQGAANSYLRQTNKVSPGNSTINPTSTYAYYGAAEVRQNPCDTTKTFKQAGMLKSETGASPDDGTTPGVITENVYDDAGRVVATRSNSDLWTCTTYDSRGRVSVISIPAFNGEAARTISNDYAVGGDPLQTTSWDSSGWVVKWTDLLGRITKYRDVHNDETTTAYDAFGNVTQRISPVGTVTYDYDAYYRVIGQKLDGVLYAQITYDQYGRVDHVDYPNAGQMKLQLSRDTFGRLNKREYALKGNKVPNPSLEQSTGTPAMPVDWQTDKWGTNTTTFTYLTTGHTGNRSGRTEITAYTSGDAKWKFNPLNVEANKTYTFSDYYRSNVATSMTMRYDYADGTFTHHKLGDLPASNTWTQASFNLTTPANVVKVGLYHVINAVGWLEVDDADLHETAAPLTISDTVTFSQSNRITSSVVQAGATQLASTYGYDAAGRLTAATVGSNTYSYGFGAQDATFCGTAANMNASSGKNSNRTSQSVNGVTTKYCYDFADRLISSTDSASNYTEYDTHGNLKLMGSNGAPIRFSYDSSDRNRNIVSFNGQGNGVAMFYGRDVQGRITFREKQNIANWAWSGAGAYHYGYTGSSDSPDFVRDSNWNIIEKSLALPGGIAVTIKPQESQAKNKKQYTLPNFQGHTLLTLNAEGINTSNGNAPANSFAYDPFGNMLPGSMLPANTAEASYGWAGQQRKLSEVNFALAPVQLGARVYLPTLGRFTQVDPVSGGSANNYVYSLDPINTNDYSGMLSVVNSRPSWRLNLQGWNGAGSYLQPAQTVTYFQPTINVSRLQSAVAITAQTRLAPPVVRAAAKPAIKPRDNSTMMAPVPVAPLTVRSNGPPNPAPLAPPNGGGSIMGTFKEYSGAAVKGCVMSASVMLAAAGTATLMTGGAAALPSGAAVALTCATGAAGGMFTHWIDPPYDLSTMSDVYDGVQGLR